MSRENIYLPLKAAIREVKPLSKDVKLFSLDVPTGFSHKAGQFVMASVWGAGEVPISITSRPGDSGAIELCVRSVGHVTSVINSLKTGDELWLRGPYGRPFPVDAKRDVLFICGGIGVMPLRPLIEELLDDSGRGAKISIIYGSRDPADVLLPDEAEAWMKRGANVVMTVDACDIENWKGCMGFVTEHLGKAKVDFKNCTAYICGPHVMIQAAMRDLSLMGTPDDRIITTLEAHMKCGVGKCGHCFCGGRLICEEGPVFTYEEIKKYRITPGIDYMA